jgi:KTSC domain
MSRVDLHSTSLQAAAYHSQWALLRLEFRSGAVYHYFGVPAQTYQQLLSAESKGGYFNHHIRNRFAYAQVRLAASPSGSQH